MKIGHAPNEETAVSAIKIKGMDVVIVPQNEGRWSVFCSNKPKVSQQIRTQLAVQPMSARFELALFEIEKMTVSELAEKLDIDIADIYIC